MTDEQDDDHRPLGMLGLLMRCCCLQRFSAPRAPDEYDIYVSDTARLLEDPTESAPPPPDYSAVERTTSADFKANEPPLSPRSECASGLSVKERTKLLRANDEKLANPVGKIEADAAESVEDLKLKLCVMRF